MLAGNHSDVTPVVKEGDPPPIQFKLDSIISVMGSRSGCIIVRLEGCDEHSCYLTIVLAISDPEYVQWLGEVVATGFAALPSVCPNDEPDDED